MNHRQIVWLASYPKSGNTWTRCFLDAYFLGSVDLNDLVCSVTDDRVDRYQIGDGTNIGDAPIDIQHLARPMSMLRLVRMFLANKYSDVPLFVKTHNPNVVANGIELLPQPLTKATIFLVRDPRDVTPSFAKHTGQSIDETIRLMDDKLRTLAGGSAKVMDLISSWDHHTRSFLEDDIHNVLTIQYEELKANPIKQFSKILKHSGVEPDMERVKKAVEMTQLDQLKRLEKKDGFKESSPHAKDQFFGEGKAGGWKEKLTPSQRHRIEKNFRSMMKRLGYLNNQKVA